MIVAENLSISVIIPVYNSVNTIAVAIRSVLECISSNDELIIVDGNSNDGTIDVLNQFAHIDNLRWISEPDRGIYDAMNKGVERASGQWFYFLGADDQLVYRNLPELVMKVNTACKVIFGKVNFENNHIMRSYLGRRTWLQNTVHHQSALYHRSLFDSFRYDITLKLLADYELNLRILDKKIPACYVDSQLALCHSGGASSNWVQSVNETNLVRERFVKAGWKRKVLSMFLTLYYSQKQLRRVLYGHRV